MTSANQRRILSVLRFMEMQLRSGSSSSQVLRNKEKESRASQLTARSLNRCRGEEGQIGPTSETYAPAASTPQSMAGWVAGNGEGEEVNRCRHQSCGALPSANP